MLIKFQQNESSEIILPKVVSINAFSDSEIGFSFFNEIVDSIPFFCGTKLIKVCGSCDIPTEINICKAELHLFPNVRCDSPIVLDDVLYEKKNGEVHGIKIKIPLKITCNTKEYIFDLFVFKKDGSRFKIESGIIYIT